MRNERLEETLAEAIAAGARAAVIFASGFLAGDSRAAADARLAAMARAAGMPICGGNCMGFYNDLDGVWICGFPSPREPRPGAIAFIAHSGSVFGALAHNDPRLRFALTVSPGQEFTTTAADYIDYALERPEVKVIGLFLETARDPAGFRAALEKAAERGVPVVVLKLGRTEAAAAAALTHTGAMAGSDLAYDALFDRYGVVRVETLDELACTLLLVRDRPPRRRRIARLHSRFRRRVRDVHRPRAARRRRLRAARRGDEAGDCRDDSTRASNRATRSTRGEPETISRRTSSTASARCSPTTTRRWVSSPPTSATAIT